MVQGKAVSVSFSKLGAFESCPLQYWLRHVLKLPVAPARAPELGNVVHEAIAAELQGQDGMKLAQELVHKNPLLDVEKDLPAALKMVEGCRRYFRPLSAHAERLVEEWLEVELDQGYILRGRADLVEVDPNTVLITDWKTNWEVFSLEDTCQLDLYARWAAVRFPGRRVMVRLRFLRYGPRKGIVMRESTPEHQEMAMNWARGLVARIREAGRLPRSVGFPACPGRTCKTCSHSVQCLFLRAQELAVPDDAPQDLLQAVLNGVVPEASGLAEAQELGLWILVLERSLSVIKDRLRSFTEAHGPVVAGGEQFGIFFRASAECGDSQSFGTALTEAGINPWEHVQWDPDWLKQFFKSPLGEKLKEQFFTETAEAYFWHRVAGEEAGQDDSGG